MGGETERVRRRLVVGRRAVLGVLVLTTVGLVATLGVPTTCRDAVAGGDVVRICEPMAATDVRVWLFALVLGLLVFPELSELELGGVVTVRRRLDEMRDDAADLRSQLAHIRTQASATSHALAATRSDIHVDVRQEQSGAALVEVRGGQSGVLDRTEEAGAYRQLAFEAGMVGLTQLLPVADDGATLIGFTVGDDGALEPTYLTADVTDEDLRQVTSLVNDPATPSTSVTALLDGFNVVAYAASHAGVVGALAVLVRHHGVPEHAELEGVGAGMEVAAATYTRLLVDLLGEGSGRGGGG